MCSGMPARKTRPCNLAYSPGELEIEATNGGALIRTDDGTGGGLGLIGRRERVNSHGGSPSNGPLPAGGVRLCARLPRAG